MAQVTPCLPRGDTAMLNRDDGPTHIAPPFPRHLHPRLPTLFPNSLTGGPRRGCPRGGIRLVGLSTLNVIRFKSICVCFLPLFKKVLVLCVFSFEFALSSVHSHAVYSRRNRGKDRPRTSGLSHLPVFCRKDTELPESQARLSSSDSI